MIDSQTFNNILNSYNDKRLRSAQNLREKKARIEAEIPELKETENEISSLYVQKAAAKINKQKAALSDTEFENKIQELLKKKDALLASKGYTEDDLHPVFECSLCKDTGYIDARMCSCFKQKITEVLYNQSNIKYALQEENFKTFTLDYYSNEIPKGETKSPLAAATTGVRKCVDFINKFSSSAENLLITGDTGCGKTFLTNCVVNEILDKGFNVIYLSAIKFFELLSEAAFEKSREEKAYITENIQNCDLLVIDDLGTELTNSFVCSALFDCVNERLLRKKHTIISTNLSVAQIKDTYSERIASRISKDYTAIRLFGNDIRMKKTLEEQNAKRRNCN